MSDNEEYVPSNFIDKITLELLMNKCHYQKYLSKSDPNKYNELQDHYAKISKYKGRIRDMTNNLLDDPELQISSEVNEVFDGYVRTLIKHFEFKDLENSSNDEDTLFGYEAMREQDAPSENANKKENMSSFWGKEKVMKKNATLDYFASSKFPRKKD
jgi:hypothetical protein